MRRWIIIMTVLGLALTAPGWALAGGIPLPTQQDYEGRIERDPHTYFGFDVVRENGNRKVKHLFVDTPYACYDGEQGYATLQVPGSFVVHHGRFGGKHRGSIKSYEITYRLHGTLRRHGKARGTFKFRAVRTSTDVCYSALLDWRARRGADVTPESPPPPGP